MKTLMRYLRLVFIVAMSLSACSTSDQSDRVGDPPVQSDNEIFVSHEQFAASGMALGQATDQRLTNTIETRGYIDVPPGSRAELSPYYPGYVKSIDILPGQHIEKGQLLFVLENPEYIDVQQAYLEVKEQITFLKGDFERQQALAENKIVSGKSAKKAASEYKMMLARFNGMKAQLELIGVSLKDLETGKITSTINLYAPISGSITKVNIARSSFIAASEVAVEIVDASHMHLELEVFEKDVTTLEEGQPIIFSVPESGQERFAGTVYLVSKSVDTEHRTVDVHGHMSKEDESRFIPGMFVTAEIITSDTTVMCLPENAIVDIDGDMTIAVLKSQDENGLRLSLVQVETGRQSDGWVEIVSPPLENEQILIDGAFAVIQ